MAEIKNKHAITLAIIGAILIIIGLCIVFIHNPLRGSGLGTICMAIGVVLIVISIIRFRHTK